MPDIDKEIQRDVKLAPFTTFRIGGPARYFAEPRSLSQYREFLEWSVTRGLPFFILGAGANILVHDSGYRGLVIHTVHLDRVEIAGTTLTAQCGVRVDGLVDISLRHSLSGLEFAAGLPGTVGGALFMNAQAFDGSFAGIVDTVSTFHLEGRVLKRRHLSRSELEFSYKQSIFQRKTHFIETAAFTLREGDEDSIRAKIEENRRKRQKRGHYSHPNAGSIFKNDYGIGKPAGQIIDETGLKGTAIGDAEVYTGHANFIINRGRATADQVYQLIRLVQEEVRKRTGIVLEREIILIGDWKEIL
jgi:UDP-N-acetylmuramate dehydrogenase